MKAERLDAILFPGASGAGIAARPGYPTVIVPFALVPNAPTPAFPVRLRREAGAVRRQLHRDGVQRAEAARARVRVRAGDEEASAAASRAVAFQEEGTAETALQSFMVRHYVIDLRRPGVRGISPRAGDVVGRLPRGGRSRSPRTAAEEVGGLPRGGADALQEALVAARLCSLRRCAAAADAVRQHQPRVDVARHAAARSRCTTAVWIRP